VANLGIKKIEKKSKVFSFEELRIEVSGK